MPEDDPKKPIEGEPPVETPVEPVEAPDELPGEVLAPEEEQPAEPPATPEEPPAGGEEPTAAQLREQLEAKDAEIAALK